MHLFNLDPFSALFKLTRPPPFDAAHIFKVDALRPLPLTIKPAFLISSATMKSPL